MAVATTFKQPCPSCEAMVTVKEGMIGKKIECHKCKDKFIALRPKEDNVDEDMDLELDEDAEDEVSTAKNQSKKSAGKGTAVSSKPAPPSKKPKLDVEDDEEEDEGDTKDGPAGKGKPSSANGKMKSGPPQIKRGKSESKTDDEDAKDSPEQKKARKKSNYSLKLTIGIGLAFVGVVVLCVAAFFLLSGRERNNPGPGPITQGNQNPEQKPETKPNTGNTDGNKTPEGTPVALTEVELAKLTNLLPPDTESVHHFQFASLFHPGSVLHGAAFENPGTLDDISLRGRMGFSILAIDSMISAERHQQPNWKYTVMHLKELIREADLTKALHLKLVATPIEGQAYYEMTEPHPNLDALARIAIGIPSNLLALNGRADNRKTLVRIYNAQTLIIGDEAPVLALLKAKGAFPRLTSTSPTPGGGTPSAGAVKLTGGTWEFVKPTGQSARLKFVSGGNVELTSDIAGPNVNLMAKWTQSGAKVTITTDNKEFAFEGSVADKVLTGVAKLTGVADDTWNLEFRETPPDPNANPDTDPGVGGGARDEMYLTINKNLKAILDRLETNGLDSKDKVLISSATEMSVNQAPSNAPEFKDRIARRPRPIWDTAQLLTEQRLRIRFLGTALVQLQEDKLRYQLRNEILCAQEIDAREFHRELFEKSSSQVARFIQRVLNHEVKVVVPEETKATPPPPPPPDGGQPPPETKSAKKEITSSQIVVKQKDATVEFVMDLVLDPATLGRIQGLATLASATIRGEMEAAAAASVRHTLARAGKQLGEKGLADREVPPGRYPPGAFSRSDSTLRASKEPRNRISWMAGLLPYLGEQNLQVYKRIQFDQSWRDPGNWPAGAALVPQFLDPMFPTATRQVAIPGLSLDFGATHYVGIAGVGLDSPSYKKGDPRRGILGYDESATLSEVDGRGLANTILMIQVPHDGDTGVAPWIAGGGATLRGVPETNSIAPFVLGTDKSGKIVQHQGKAGTYVLMADGSVRFIDRNVPDDVFKAMCVAGGGKSDVDLTNNPHILPVPEPKGVASPRRPVDVPVKKPPEPPPQTDPKKDPPKAKSADEIKAALQGSWSAVSIQFNGLQAPPEVLKAFVVTFKGDKIFIPTQAGKTEEGKFWIDVTKTPYHMDTLGPKDKAPDLGIFEFNGAELRLCVRPTELAALGRPTAFTSENGSMLMVLRKQGK